MQKRISYFVGLLITLFLGSSLVIGGDSGICPDPHQGYVAPDVFQEEAVPMETKTLVPRNQVLLEIATGTW